jgi:hypothetical protein
MKTTNEIKNQHLRQTMKQMQTHGRLHAWCDVVLEFSISFTFPYFPCLNKTDTNITLCPQFNQMETK